MKISVYNLKEQKKAAAGVSETQAVGASSGADHPASPRGKMKPTPEKATITIPLCSSALPSNSLSLLSVSACRLFFSGIRVMAASSSLSVPNLPSAPPESNAEMLRINRILTSKLYFDVPLSKVPFIYSSSYNIAFMGIEKLHPFDSAKWGRICQFLMEDGVLDKKKIVEPVEASEEDLLVVHSKVYLHSLKSSSNVCLIVEVPPIALLPNCIVQQKVLYPFRKQVGGTILGAKLAKERGWAINAGGGFHHCSAERGGGFCVVMIIDLDAHQGNGHERDFPNDSRVYILDMYNSGIYPFDMEARRFIDQKVELVSGTTTSDYLEKLDGALQVAEHAFDPELIIYNAGTDILDGDPLGRLKVSPEGVIERDEKVFKFSHNKKVPIVMVTSGGYMKSSARVIADSIANLSKKCLIELKNTPC